MGINNSPPVQLSPDIDKAQTTAFINENFRKISDSFNPLQISDGTNNRITLGKYAASQYGFVGTDTDGTRRILIGQSPDDGRSGIWVSKAGVDVITELGG
jgi:hypothetical protein